ncbi:MAG: DUF707 domain-containing protein, partial [Halomonas sp.]|nr:DUF707 domain-containing protein [Halomonas sp.]
MKPVLIVCRAESYHKAPEWLSTSASEYDVLISQYGVDADEKHHACNGGKWIGICDLFNSNPELLEKYDYFWFPDDDIQTDPSDVVDFFKTVQAHGFQLSQPSLTPQSVYAYRLTISNPRFNFRLTNFVELMMPLVHKDLLHK